MSAVSNMFNRLSGQPDSYEKKSRYRMGKTLGAGTYGIVREADCAAGKVAVKIIMKKNVKGNEAMVYEELEMLQNMHHPHIVKFVDWFESKDKFYIVTQLALGGELFQRIVDEGRFTEKDGSQTIRQVLEAVDYLHDHNVVHRDLKPENLLYLTPEHNSPLVLADFGIAKMLEKPDEILTTMAGSFGYAAPEVMKREGHGKPCDMWSLGVITYTLLCGYSPFRSEGLADLITETQSNRVTFHERYWKDISNDAKEFIKGLLQTDPARRATSKEALKHHWLTGASATDKDLVKELRSRQVKARLKIAVQRIQLAKRIELLKQQESPSNGDLDMPQSPVDAANEAFAGKGSSLLSRKLKGDIFRAVVLAKAREIKAQKEAAGN